MASGTSAQRAGGGKKIAVHRSAGQRAWAPIWTAAAIEVYGNAQDATGDTMNDGEIVIHGSSGDATGYAMRGGAIYIEKDAGYRCGIHMKEYGSQRCPSIVIGGRCGQLFRANTRPGA